MPNNELVFRHVNAVMTAERQLTRGLWFGNDLPSQEANKLVLFTFSEQAKDDSRNNLRICLDYAERMGSEYFVATEYKLQWVGQKVSLDLNKLFNKKFNDEFQRELKCKSKLEVERESVYAECATVRRYGINLFLKPEYGVYHVPTRKRIKNRRVIIEEFWRLGFPTKRGRVPSIGDLKWSGPRDHIEDLVRLALFYRKSLGKSAVAGKIYAAKNSINREYAWPGHW